MAPVTQRKVLEGTADIQLWGNTFHLASSDWTDLFFGVSLEKGNTADEDSGACAL